MTIELVESLLAHLYLSHQQQKPGLMALALQAI